MDLEQYIINSKKMMDMLEQVHIIEKNLKKVDSPCNIVDSEFRTVIIGSITLDIPIPVLKEMLTIYKNSLIKDKQDIYNKMGIKEVE